jgi:hypothetical protein
MILRSMRMHPYRACIFFKIHTYVEKYAKIRIKYGKDSPEWHRMSNIRRKIESKPLFIYARKKAYAEGLLNHMAYSVCMYIHTPTAYDRTTQPYLSHAGRKILPRLNRFSSSLSGRKPSFFGGD